MTDSTWTKPRAWNRLAAQRGTPLRVFCASMADVFEIHPVDAVNAELDAARSRLWSLIEETPHLVWQLLTKRPGNVQALVPWAASGWPDNVWLGTSVEDNRRAAERIPLLCEVPARVRFLSCEPLLEHVDLTGYLDRRVYDGGEYHGDVGNVAWCRPQIDWVIAGGESGRDARSMDLDWARSLVNQCRTSETPVFVKQLGSRFGRGHRDIDQFPPDLRVRECPPPEAAGAVRDQRPGELGAHA